MDTRAELNFKSLIEHDKIAQKIIELLNNGGQLEVSVYDRSTSRKEWFCLSAPPQEAIDLVEKLSIFQRQRVLESAVNSAQQQLKDSQDLLERLSKANSRPLTDEDKPESNE